MPPDSRIAFEREFLIRLAAIYLACRWKVMGHQLRGWPYGSDLAFSLLGMHDYEWEMRLLCAERLGITRSRFSQAPTSFPFPLQKKYSASRLANSTAARSATVGCTGSAAGTNGGL